jgi:hypothetical protein
MREFLEGHARALYWLAIIKLVRLLTWAGAVSVAEWIARETGLRARVVALLYGPRYPGE